MLRFIYLSNFNARRFTVLSKDNNSNKPKKHNHLNALARFSQIGSTMAASILVGVLLGDFLDGLFNTGPWLLLVFSLLGVGAAIKALFNISKGK